MTKLLLLIPLFIASIAFSQSKVSNSGKIHFQSLNKKDVKADCISFTSKIDINTKKIVFSVPIQGFEFKQALMQKHFNNDKNMNSVAFPKAKFVGTITSEIDFTKDGVYEVEVAGKITIRDVTKDYTAKGTITIKDGQIEVRSTFVIPGNDFGLTTKYAKEIEITLYAIY
ncbi:YceI family protein [Cyclobacteriaceae bacterium]|nr:YceI family protein [Cyclobacteriaceae bacterium]